MLQIIHKEPILRGPYKTDAEREHELDMCFIDPGTEYIVLIDPGYPPHTWMPSYSYRKERMDRLDNLPLK